MKNKSKWIEKIFRSKKKSRKKIAELPLERKLQMLIEMQKAASPILRARGLQWKPWRTSEMFQVKDRPPNEHADTFSATLGTISVPFQWKGLT